MNIRTQSHTPTRAHSRMSWDRRSTRDCLGVCARGCVRVVAAAAAVVGAGGAPLEALVPQPLYQLLHELALHLHHHLHTAAPQDLVSARDARRTSGPMSGGPRTRCLSCSGSMLGSCARARGPEPATHAAQAAQRQTAARARHRQGQCLRLCVCGRARRWVSGGKLRFRKSERMRGSAAARLAWAHAPSRATRALAELSDGARTMRLRAAARGKRGQIF